MTELDARDYGTIGDVSSTEGVGQMGYVLIVDDERGYRELYAQALHEAGIETRCVADAAQAFASIECDPPTMVVSDVRMPGEDGLSLLRRVRKASPSLPFLLVTAFAEIRDAVAALKLGAVDYLAKPVDLDLLTDRVRSALGLPNGPSRSTEIDPAALVGIVAESPPLREVLATALRVAASDATILVTGESGVGKEVVAQLLHRQSRRAEKSLVEVNCGAIPPDLLASELFGHERGAFTGASASRTGRFRQADRGTLFLDEVGEIPLEVQPLLLRVLETGKVTPLGGDREIPTDVRLIAATNRDLEVEVAEGRFRADLYYRLNVIALEVPPLRERPEDILPLARFFLTRGEGGSLLTPAAAELLTRYCWPGNVRELSNAMERARLLARSEVILPEHLPRSVRDPSQIRSAPPTAAISEKVDVETLEEAEAELIRRALAASDGNRTHAARTLGISRRGLINKINRYQL